MGCDEGQWYYETLADLREQVKRLESDNLRLIETNDRIISADMDALGNVVSALRIDNARLRAELESMAAENERINKAYFAAVDRGAARLKKQVSRTINARTQRDTLKADLEAAQRRAEAAEELISRINRAAENEYGYGVEEAYGIHINLSITTPAT